MESNNEEIYKDEDLEKLDREKPFLSVTFILKVKKGNNCFMHKIF